MDNWENNKMKDIYSRNNKKICYMIFAIFSLAYFIYCNMTYVELPYLSWFDQMPIAELYFLGKLQIRDLFSKYVEHGMLANNIIFLINTIFFHGTTLFDVYLNDINVVVCGGILIYSTAKTLEDRKDTAFWVIAECVFMFSLFQGSAGAMDTQVRLGLLFFLLAMLMINGEWQDDCSKLHFVGTLILIVLSINAFGTLYSFAGVPCVWAIVMFRFLNNRKWNKRDIIISGTYLMTIPAYLIEYGGFGGGDKLNSGSFFSIILHPIEMMKGIFAWYANGVLGWAYHESDAYRSNIFLAVGAIVFVLTAISVVLFFRQQMYQKTWLPLMCIVYSFGVFALVYLGRDKGWEWFSSEWYTVHIKVSIAATIWIYAYTCNRNKIFKIGALVTGICALTVGIVGNDYAIKRAPLVRNFYAEKQKYLYISNEEDMPVDEMGQTPLLHSLDVTMNSIEIMKKYNLSVYQYWDAYEACPTTRLQDNTIKYIRGRYDDGWCEKEMQFAIHTNDISELEVSYMALKQQNITIIINDIIEDTICLNEGEGKFVIPCKTNTDMNIVFRSDYAAEMTPPDKRVASYHLSDIRCIE